MARHPSRRSAPARASGIPPATMKRVHEIALIWTLTRSIPTVEIQWTAMLFDERRAGRLSNLASDRYGLKSLLAPFKKNLPELRELVSEMKDGMGGRAPVTGHGVFSKGRSIPVDAGSEPEPEMGDLGALGGTGSKSSDEDELTSRLTSLAKKILGKSK